MRTIIRTLSATLGALALSGCGMLSTSTGTSLSKVDDLVACIERVHVEAEIARDRSGKAITALQTMAAQDFRGDALLAHAELQRAIEQAEKQAKDLRFAVDRMKRAAEPVFYRWNKDIEAMQSPEIKQRSRERCAETRERYDAIVAAADPMLLGYDKINRTLRDHALFLGHDFNAGAVATLSPELDKLGASGRELRGSFEQCMKAARAYVDQAALPMRVEAARPQ